jgi:hypothetical protein
MMLKVPIVLAGRRIGASEAWFPFHVALTTSIRFLCNHLKHDGMQKYE